MATPARAPAAGKNRSTQRARNAPLRVPSLPLTLTLQSAVTQRVYKRVFERLKADLYTLTVRTRTVDMDEAADIAEKIIDDLFSHLERDLQEDIRRTDVLMAQEGIEDTPEYASAKLVNATFTTPQAKRYLDLLSGVDTLIARLDVLWLNGVIDARNCKDRAYQWQRRLFRAANQFRERAIEGRRAMQKLLDARTRRGAARATDVDRSTETADTLDAQIDAGAATAADDGDGDGDDNVSDGASADNAAPDQAPPENASSARASSEEASTDKANGAGVATNADPANRQREKPATDTAASSS